MRDRALKVGGGMAFAGLALGLPFAIGLTVTGTWWGGLLHAAVGVWGVYKVASK